MSDRSTNSFSANSPESSSNTFASNSAESSANQVKRVAKDATSNAFTGENVTDGQPGFEDLLSGTAASISLGGLRHFERLKNRT